MKGGIPAPVAAPGKSITLTALTAFRGVSVEELDDAAAGGFRVDVAGRQHDVHVLMSIG